jgi:sortase (surface protein transpeptidase)
MARWAVVIGLLLLVAVARCNGSGSQAVGADPLRIRIPAIGVDARVQPLTVDENGVLPPPDTYDSAGWWRTGPEPGDRGPAVIAGHVDSERGPAVFFRLPDLDRGDQIFVDRADGTTAVFATQRIERRDKNAFPTDAVYGDTPDSQLRLITCGGKLDRKAHSYVDTSSCSPFDLADHPRPYSRKEGLRFCQAVSQE